ncbi:pre-mRNA 3' end processing protein WDR33 [Bacillus rossius redtenbacheri]|uniref:pre-mRNA 3' end processing protein WDR33 n=1 Tax=Bacillus rossius redtenbacheri TaxID=93214 RepID=UPI002FDD1525
MLQVSPFSQPPPQIGLGLPNLSVPPPHHFPNRFHNDRGGHRGHFFQPFRPYPRPGPGGAATDAEFDGKRLRKSVMRKTVDYNSSVIKMLEGRVWQRDHRDRRALQPDVLYYPDLQPPHSYADNPINAVTTRFVKTATNKMRCPIFCMAWTPEGRRLVTGASSGEFTLWNGLTFNFETILQAHDSPVRTMVWSHNDVWMVTGDHAGYVKYWQSNMNNVKMFQAHKEALRGLSFSSTDHKFVTCSDDGTLRIWDFMRCHEERILRGHGADVKCVDWHPQKGLIVSGSKDNQQPVKLWDPKTGQSLATLHAHKSTVMDIKWNRNGNWLVTASRDHLLKLFDVRNLSQEVQTFRGHKKEASSVSWHPCHEGLFASGGSDGAILFWHVGADKEVGGIEQAHDSIVWTLAWHPMGHILCSGSNDHSSKFWTRNRPGDSMTDKYNLNTTPAGLPGIDELDMDEPAVIPGMGPEDKVDVEAGPEVASIPGLDMAEAQDDKTKASQKKVPYSKPIPRNFQAQWNETGHSMIDESRDDDEAGRKDSLSEAISQLMETNPPPGVVPVAELQPQAIIIYGKLLQVEGNPLLQKAIAGGAEALSKLIHSGQLEELTDVLPQDELRSEGDEPGQGPTREDLDMRGPPPLYPPPLPDQDMRFAPGDVDLRRLPLDEDLRGPPPGHAHFFADEDMRVPGSDVDLRRGPVALGPVHLDSPPPRRDSPAHGDAGDAPGGARKVLLTTPQFRPGAPEQPPWMGSPHEAGPEYDHSAARGRGTFPHRDFGRGGRGSGVMNMRPPFGPDVPGPFGRGRGMGPPPPFAPNANFQGARFPPGDVNAPGGMFQEENMHADGYGQFASRTGDADEREVGNVYGDNFGPGRPVEGTPEGMEYGPGENVPPAGTGFGPPRQQMGEMRGAYGRGGRVHMVGAPRGHGGFYPPGRHGAGEGDGGNSAGPDRQPDPGFDARFGRGGMMSADRARGRGGFHQPARQRPGDGEENHRTDSTQDLRFGPAGRAGGGMRGRGAYHAPFRHGRAEEELAFSEPDDDDMEEDPLELAQRIDKDLRDDEDGERAEYGSEGRQFAQQRRGYDEGGESDGEGGKGEGWAAPPIRRVGQEDWAPARGSRGVQRGFRRPRGAARGRFRGGRPRRAGAPSF